MTEKDRAIEALIKSYEIQFGYCKVGLVHETGDSEGVWAVFANAESHRRYKDENSHNEEILLYLDNQPIGTDGLQWGGKNWGDSVIARTQGTARPKAFLADQQR